jgi:XTP/dITP diphosphohydrolase
LRGMTTLLIATRNAHKVGEICAILGETFRYLTLNDFPAAPAVVEDAETFAGNATKKATELALWLARVKPSTFNLPPSTCCVLADDSGLEVDALGGQPGVRSARFAAEDPTVAGNTPDAANNAKLLRLLQDVPPGQRTARFHCVIALVAVGLPSTPHAVPIFDGVCEGRIDKAPRGRGGFGYDPLFVPTGYEASFAELGEAVKNQISHRAQALQKLRSWLVARA